MGPSTPVAQACLRLMPVAVVITITSLSVHVLMLQVLRIPYPDMSGIGRVGLVLVVLRIFALLLVYRLSSPALDTLRLPVRIAAVALLDMAVAGNARAAVMDAVVTTGLAFPTVRLLVDVAESVVLAAFVVALRPLLRRTPGLIASALVLAGATTFLIAPAARWMLAPFARLRRPEVFTEPYGVYVLSWSYAMFLETTAAVMGIAILVGARLSIRPAVALLQFVTLVLLLRGTLVMQLVFPWFMHGGMTQSLLSTSQFFLQDVVLAVMAWLAWRRPGLPDGAFVMTTAAGLDERHAITRSGKFDPAADIRTGHNPRSME